MSLTDIKNLRIKTGAGVLDCKTALQESQDNFERALEWLKKRGLARAEKKSLRLAKEGRIGTYLHGEGRIGVLVEVNVETDFAARSEDFKTFVHHLCLHIAAMNPLFIYRKDVPKEVSQKERNVFMEQVQREGKKASICDKIVEGRMNKWFSEVCLMEQNFLISSQNNESKTIEEVLKDMISKLGENILIRRFVRFELGEELSPASHLKSIEEIS